MTSVDETEVGRMANLPEQMGDKMEFSIHFILFAARVRFWRQR